MSFDYVLIFLMNFEVFIHIFCNLNFVWMFKFVFSCQPLYYYIHKVLKRCPTERYIKPVRIPGYLWFILFILVLNPFKCLQNFPRLSRETSRGTHAFVLSRMLRQNSHLFGGTIFIYLFPAGQASFQFKFKLTNLKSNLLGKTWIHEYMNIHPLPYLLGNLLW